MINRDGFNKSLWQDSVPEYIPSKVKSGINKYDVIIVGGGITGISTALLLQEAGKQCLVLESNNLCFGTTGGTTAHLNTLLDTSYTIIKSNFNKEAARQVADATAEAIQLIRQNISRFQLECGFAETEAFLFAQEEKQQEELEEIRAASEEAGLRLKYVQEIPLPIPFLKALKIYGQAKFNPVEYVYGIAAAFEKAGGVILQHCRVITADETETVNVETNNGTFTADQLIYATHIPPGVNVLHLRCIPYRSYAMAVTLEDEAYPLGLSYDMYDPYFYYRTQEVNGQPYLIAGGKDHKTGHEENAEQCFLQLEAQVRKYFKVREIAYRWSSQYFEPADGLPYIGHLPGHPGNIYVATGFGGNGMVYSSVAALLLKRMILALPSPLEELFDPNRIKPIAGFGNFISHNSDVIKQFFSKFFTGEKLSVLADLAPGEASIVKVEDHKIALYKEPNGCLHAIDPVCTHLKCEVKWNSAERSWDCPCHGARYSYDGKVLTGPADKDLEIIELPELIKGKS